MTMINILFGGNHKVYDGILLCLMSMTKHCKNELSIYILTADITELNPDFKPIQEEQRKFLEDYIKKTNQKSKVTLITLNKTFNEWIMSSENKLNTYTPFAFLRLFADKIKDLPNKIIYMDTDIMCNGNIKELFDIDIENYELGVVKDRLGKVFIKHNYFNSGVLLMNLDKIRETNLFDRVKDLCLTKKMAFPDQSALNKLCKYKLYLPRKFNEQGNPRKDTVIQHFCKRLKSIIPLTTINIKQWEIEKVQKVYKIHNYDDIYEQYKSLNKN